MTFNNSHEVHPPSAERPALRDEERERRKAPLVLGRNIMAATGVMALALGGTLLVSSPIAGAKTKAAGKESPKVLVRQAQAQIDKYLKKPAFVAPGPPVKASSLKGKKILVVAHDLIAAVLVDVAKGVQQAGDALGMPVSVFNGEGTVSTIEQGITQGISQGVGAIVLDGVAVTLVPSSIAAAAKAHIPLIPVAQGLHVSNPTVFGGSTADYPLLGQLVADTAIVHAKGGPVTAAVIDFNNPEVGLSLKGIEAEFKKCGKKCAIVKKVNVTPQNWPTQVPSTTEALIKADPKVNYVFGVLDDTMGMFATSGVQASGSSNVAVVSGDGSSAGPLKLVKNGGPFLADPGQSSVWTGCGAVDQALRAMTGMKPGNDITPPRYLDQKDLHGANVTNLDTVYGTSYVTGFKKLWGISG